MAAYLLSGFCDLSPSAATARMCDGYVPMQDDRGNDLLKVSCSCCRHGMHAFHSIHTSLPLTPGDNLMKGAVLYEAYAAFAITLPTLATVAYMAGECNIAPKVANKPPTCANSVRHLRYPEICHPSQMALRR